MPKLNRDAKRQWMLEQIKAAGKIKRVDLERRACEAKAMGRSSVGLIAKDLAKEGKIISETENGLVVLSPLAKSALHPSIKTTGRVAAQSGINLDDVVTETMRAEERRFRSELSVKLEATRRSCNEEIAEIETEIAKEEDDLIAQQIMTMRLNALSVLASNLDAQIEHQRNRAQKLEAA